MRPILAGILAMLVLSGHATVARAHLSIIRQGPESRGGIESGDHSGSALAVGDFDGDGFEDLAVGAPDEDLGSATGAGAVIVSWGCPTGLTHVGAQLVTAAGLGFADQSGARFGAALAAGDFNDDGRADLVIGAPLENVGADADAGRMYVVYGTASGLAGTGAAYDETSGGGGLEPGDQFGASFAVGNFNGDASGYMDLAVGSPGEDANAGAVFLNYLGSSTGLTTASVVPIKQSTFGGTNDAGDRFGEALAAGNLLGGVHAELAIGAPGNGGNLFTAIGAVWVLLGAAGGSTTAGAIFLDALDVGGSLESNARFGSALVTGRLYSGSYRSLAIGEPNRVINGVAGSGRVYVVEGGASDFDYANAVDLHKGFGSQSLQANEHFGAALAAGDWNGSGGLDELAVGIPDDKIATAIAGKGSVMIFPGDTSGPHTTIARLIQSNHGDPNEEGDRHGAALAFGQFDDTNQGALAIGAPGESNETPIYEPTTIQFECGAVHVVAPWRQVVEPKCYTAMVTDCAGAPVYSLKPFEQVKIASTTKLMTLLLAAERIQAGAVAMDDTYDVPMWAASDGLVNGSQSKPPLAAHETLTLRGLLTYMIFHSGNDATYCVADMLEGGAGQTNQETFGNNVENFVVDMNTKAAALGMTRTEFTNPNGFDHRPGWFDSPGDHHSCAWDMAMLMRAGMLNPVFKDVCGRESLTVARDDTVATINYSWQIMKLDKVDGGKPGKTPLARKTGVFDAYDPAFGHIVGCTFGHVTRPEMKDDCVELLNLGFAACDISPIFANDVPFQLVLNGASTKAGMKRASGSDLDHEGDLYVDAFRQAGSLATTATFELGKHSEIELPPGEQATIGIRPFNGHLGYTIANPMQTALRVNVTPSAGPGAGLYTIPAGGVLMLPPYTAISSTFTLTIENADATGNPVELSILETYAQTLTSIPAAGGGPVRSWRMFRDPHVENDGYWLMVTGLDTAPNPGSLYAVAHENDNLIGVEPTVAPPAGSALQLTATPNPSRDRTRIALDLAAPADLSLAIYDVAGREVARVDPGRVPAGPWAWEWDGRSNGVRVRSGIYFARVVSNGTEAASARITRLQ